MGFQYYPNLDVINNTYEKEKIGFYFSLSPQISYLYEKKHNLELGISGLYFYNKRVDVTVSVFSRYIITCIGYRYQKPDGGICWRIASTPIIHSLPDNTSSYDKEFAIILYLCVGVLIVYPFKYKKE